MKKLLLIFLIAMTYNAYADLSVEQVQEMVRKIHEKREGVKLDTLNETKEPFVRLEEKGDVSVFVIPKVVKEKVKLKLHAIVNGKAYINDRWLDEGESILGYELKYIGKRGVVMRNENHIKKLFLRKYKDSFITIEER